VSLSISGTAIIVQQKIAQRNEPIESLGRTHSVLTRRYMSKLVSQMNYSLSQSIMLLN